MKGPAVDKPTPGDVNAALGVLRSAGWHVDEYVERGILGRLDEKRTVVMHVRGDPTVPRYRRVVASTDWQEVTV